MNQQVMVGASANTLEMSSLKPWLVCFSAALFFFYEFIQLNMFNSISTHLMHSFSVSALKLGNLSATYLVADVIFLLPAGMILDRFSVRKVILFALSLCTAGTILFAIATNFWFAAACHFVAGIGNAFSFLSCMMLASRWFPPRRMALVTGLIVTFAMTGGLIAQTPLVLLVDHFGWRHAVMLNGVLGVIILCINWLVIQDHPHTGSTGTNYQTTRKAKIPFIQSLVAAVKNLQNWCFGLYTSLLNLPIMLLGALWGTMTLMQVHHLTATQASYVTSMIFVGTIVGGPIIGWVSDQLARRILPMLIFGLLSIATMLALIYIPGLTLMQLLLAFFLLGFFTSAQIISYPAIAESNSPAITGTATGLASCIIMGGAAIAQPFFGWLLNLHWDQQMLNGAPLYSADNFSLALLMIPSAFMVGIIALLLCRETFCRPYNPN